MVVGDALAAALRDRVGARSRHLDQVPSPTAFGCAGAPGLPPRFQPKRCWGWLPLHERQGVRGGSTAGSRPSTQQPFAVAVPVPLTCCTDATSSRRHARHRCEKTRSRDQLDAQVLVIAQNPEVRAIRPLVERQDAITTHATWEERDPGGEEGGHRFSA